MLRRLALPPNNWVRSHMSAAEPLLTALCNSRAPLVALGRQESVCRVVVCKSGGRTHSVSPTLDLHNRRAEPELCSHSHEARSRHWGITLGPMQRLLKSAKVANPRTSLSIDCSVLKLGSSLGARSIQ